MERLVCASHISVFKQEVGRPSRQATKRSATAQCVLQRVSLLLKVLTLRLPRRGWLQFPDLRTSRKAELNSSLCRSFTSSTCKPVVFPEFQVPTFLIQQHLKGINVINSYNSFSFIKAFDKYMRFFVNPVYIGNSNREKLE